MSQFNTRNRQAQKCDLAANALPGTRDDFKVGAQNKAENHRRDQPLIAEPQTATSGKTKEPIFFLKRTAKNGGRRNIPMRILG